MNGRSKNRGTATGRRLQNGVQQRQVVPRGGPGFGTEVADYVQNTVKNFTPGWTHKPIDLARKGFKKLFGFAERRVQPGSEPGRAGGITVETEQAPVAFPRRPVGVVANHYRENNRDFIHFHDMFDASIVSAATNTFTVQNSTAIDPTSASILPNLADIAINFDRFRIHKLCFHYEHYAPTSDQCEITLAWTPDGNAPNPTTLAEMISYENAVSGACYEDFSLEVDPASLSRIPWLWTYAYSSAATNRFEYCGQVFLSTGNNTASVPCGNCWVEMVVELADFKSENQVGVTGLMHRLIAVLRETEDVDERKRLIREAVMDIERRLLTLKPTVHTQPTNASSYILDDRWGPKSEHPPLPEPSAARSAALPVLTPLRRV